MTVIIFSCLHFVFQANFEVVFDSRGRAAPAPQKSAYWGGGLKVLCFVVQLCC
jgi:hypothetical protein